jgi:hypothetical protein
VAALDVQLLAENSPPEKTDELVVVPLGASSGASSGEVKESVVGRSTTRPAD